MLEPAPPVIGIILGDHAGIGPEIVAKALASAPPAAPIVVVGDLRLFQATLSRHAPAVSVRPYDAEAIRAAGRGASFAAGLTAYGLDTPADATIAAGELSAASGRLSYRATLAAIELARQGAVAGLVLAPLTKQALHLAGTHYDSEFEMFADEFQASNVKAVVRGGDIFRCTVVGHCAFVQIAERLSTAGIVETGRQLLATMARFGARQRGIAVAALNPHAGEGGLFGDEEILEIAPAIAAGRAAGYDIHDCPLPPDTVFYRMHHGQFDAVIAMYHDQGHIPVKIVDFAGGVNVTLGLPIIRTSVDHGTVFGKAGKGTADPSSLLAAIRLATQMAAHRQGDPTARNA